MSARQTRADGKPRNQWALWMARRARMDGKSEQELAWEQRADELSHDEQRAQQAAKERENARKWRAAGGDEAWARQYEVRADALEQPAVYPWPGGTSRALAERVALQLWPDMPVADAPDAALHGILSWCMEHDVQRVYQARNELLDGGFAAREAAKAAEGVAKTNAADAARVDAEPPTNGASEWASPHAQAGIEGWASPPPGTRKKRKAGR